MIVAAVVYYVWGAIWFTIFGAAWQAATHVAMSFSPSTLVISFLMGLALAYATAIALKDSSQQTARHGVEFAVFMSVAFWMTQLLNTTLYEQKSLVLWAIDSFYVVIGAAIMGAIIGGWRKR